MAKIPNVDAVGDFKWTSPRQVSRYDGSAMGAPGRAMQGLGSSIASLGNAIGGAIDSMSAEDEKRAKFETELRFQNLDQEIDDYVVEQQRNIAEDGGGFRASITQEVDT